MTRSKRTPKQTQSWDEVPETLEAIKELESGQGKRYSSYNDIMQDILSDEDFRAVEELLSSELTDQEQQGRKRLAKVTQQWKFE